MKLITFLFSGLIFGLGLIVSGMADPAKVQNFLDLFGIWDPSLAFVMGGAIAVTMPGFALLKRWNKPVFETGFAWPTRTDLDPRLLSGAAIFGIGWGLGGFCPGPALTSVLVMANGTFVFVAAMFAGMWIAKLSTSISSPKPALS